MTTKASKVAAVALAALTLAGCAQSKTICGVDRDPYGLINEDDAKSPDVRYDPSWGNILLGAFFVETILLPIYFWGYAAFEPEGSKSGNCKVSG